MRIELAPEDNDEAQKLISKAKRYGWAVLFNENGWSVTAWPNDSFVIHPLRAKNEDDARTEAEGLLSGVMG